MKPKEEIRTFFDNELLEDLKEFDRLKKEVIKDTFKWRVLYISGFLLVFLIFIINSFSSYSLGYLIIIGLVISAYFFLTAGQKENEIMTKIENSYKWNVVPRMLENIFDEVKYIPNQFISIKAIEQSNIFGDFFNFEYGEDYFKCEIGDIIFQFSEISLSKTGLLTNRNEFKGIFCVSEFNKSFNTITKIMPVSHFSLKKSEYQWYTESNALDRVYLEDPDFNKKFVVYAEDQVESRYILTPSFMSKIIDMQEKLKSDFVLSFKQNRLNMFIENYDNLFEPPVNELYADFEYFYKNINYFILFASIVDELNLNVKIWGRA